MRLFHSEKRIAIDLDVLGGDPYDPSVPMFARFKIANGEDYHAPQFLGLSRQEIETKVKQWATQEGFTMLAP